MKKLLLVLNPVAGTKKASKHLTEIISVFNRAAYDTHVYITTKQGDTVTAVKDLGSDADLIVCCGGDGTLNETITGILQLGRDIPIGYIPAGSTNDFANSLKLSFDVIKAAQQIVEGEEHLYDVGKFGDRYFTYVASFGTFTKASYSTQQNVKNALGHVAYIIEGIQELSGIRKEHIKLQLDDDEILEDDYLFCAICNSTSVGGILTLKPDVVDMSDGKFEILLIHYPKDIQKFCECIIALSTQNYESEMITLRSASKVKVILEGDMPWSLDGEKADGNTEVCIENLHHRIKLIH